MIEESTTRSNKVTSKSPRFALIDIDISHIVKPEPQMGDSDAVEALLSGSMMYLVVGLDLEPRLFQLSADKRRLQWNLAGKASFSKKNSIGVKDIVEYRPGMNSPGFKKLTAPPTETLCFSLRTKQKEVVEIVAFDPKECDVWLEALYTLCPQMTLIGPEKPSSTPSPPKATASSTKGKKKDKSPADDKKIFGTSLSRGPRVEIPQCVVELITYLEAEALETEGLFRVPGNADLVNVMRKAYDEGQLVDIENYGIHCAAALLKLFLRELPEPLLTFELYDCFVAVHTINVPEARYAQIRNLIHLLPPTYRGLLQYLCRFLLRVSYHHEVNRMDCNNLAIVFTPNVLRAESDTFDVLVEDMPSSVGIVTSLIADYEFIFNSPT